MFGSGSGSSMLDRVPGASQQQMYRKLTGKLIRGEAGDILTGLIASKEIAMLDAVDDLHDEMEIELIDEIPDKDERKEQLKSLVEALAADDVPAFWFEEVAEERLDNVDDAREFLALDADEWATYCDTWVQQYRKQGSDLPRSEVVNDYLNRKFGVPPRWFVRNVVLWNHEKKRSICQRFLIGNFNAVESGVRVAEQTVREHNEAAREEDDATAD